LGFIIPIVILAIGGYLFVRTGMLPAGQDQKPGALETWAAKTSLKATVDREARLLKSPLQPTEPNLIAGATLYVEQCQVCHGGVDAAPSSITKGLTPDPPQLAKDGVEDDPEGTTYWKIAHGIHFTGMPAFRPALSETQMWRIALFLKHMDSLPAGVRQAWGTAKGAHPPPVAH
jgi:mono/diheme cytochrome c family protein